jgi:N1221-like protein
MTLQTSSVSFQSPRNRECALERSLVSMDPPLPVYLFNVVSGLRDKSAKGYPVKKVFKPFPSRFLFLSPLKLLLVLWKTILSCCGGFRDLERVKKVSRELAGLTPIPEEGSC